jgi:hypothetical protein
MDELLLIPQKFVFHDFVAWRRFTILSLNRGAESYRTLSRDDLLNAELFGNYFKLLFAGDLGVPFILSFGQLHSFTFHCVGHDHGWLIRISKILGRFQCGNDLVIVMSIDLQNAPAK